MSNRHQIKRSDSIRKREYEEERYHKDSVYVDRTIIIYKQTYIYIHITYIYLYIHIAYTIYIFLYISLYVSLYVSLSHLHIHIYTYTYIYVSSHIPNIRIYIYVLYLCPISLIRIYKDICLYKRKLIYVYIRPTGRTYISWL